MSIFVAIVGLALVIFVHELGHFLTSLAVGMRPRKFYVGFPPAIAKVRRGGIEYGIGAIPLGGFVKIPGMHRPVAGDLDVHFARALREAPELTGAVERSRRKIEAGEYEAAASALGELEHAVSNVQLSPEAAKAARRGLTELRDGVGPDAYWRQRTWKRMAAIFAGPGANVVFAIVLFAVLFMVGGGKATTVVDEVLPGRPAAEAGLRAGDRILRISGASVEPADIPRIISASKGRPLTLDVERERRVLRLGPVRPVEEDGAYRLGFRLRGESLTFGEAAWSSVKLTGIVTREIGKSLVRLVHREGQREISGPVGIVHGSSDALEQGVQDYLWVLGLISLSLALLNLLPLLPLDGGHIAFSIVEGLRGRAVGREIYERVSAVGIALVLLLFFVGLSNDVGRLGGG